MNRLTLAAAAVAAAAGLTACSHPTSTHASTSAHGSGHSTAVAIAPVSCSQQYRAWSQHEGKGVMDALGAVTTAASSRHHQATAVLKNAAPAVAKAAKHPIPACADPRGYWSVLLMHVDAAVSGKGSASSKLAAMQDVPKIHQQLLAEVKQAVR
jgi:hypothetical protein